MMDGVFEVVGEDGDVYHVSAEDVMGAVMGMDDDDDDYDYDVDGEVGRRRGRRRRRRGVRRMAVKKPGWRNKQLAPGVQAPDQGMMPLPLTAVQNGGVFDVNTTRIVFQGFLQKPFRGERLLVSVVRTGATAVGRVLSQLFVGTDLQQADIEPFDVEQVGQTQAFGVRLTMQPAQPGVLFRLPTVLSTPVTGADTVQVNMQVLGRIIS